MKRFKITAFLLIISMLCMLLQASVFAAIDESEYEDDEEIIDNYIKSTLSGPEFFLDFEKFEMGDAASADLYLLDENEVLPVEYDKEHGKSLRLGKAGVATAERSSVEVATDGVWLFSFDYRTSKLVDRSYLRFVNSLYTGNNSANDAYMFEVFGKQTNKIGIYYGIEGWTLSRFSKIIQADTWYHVDIWVDFATAKIYMYIDNDYIDAANMPANFYNIAGFIVTSNSTDAKAYNIFDNISLKKMKPEMIQECINKGLPVPQSAISPVGFAISTAEIGNIFYDQNDVLIDTKVINKLEENFKGTVKYQVLDSSGNLLWEKTEKTDIEPGGIVEKQLKPVVDSFDIFTFNICAVSDKDGEEHNFERQFSIAHVRDTDVNEDRIGLVTDFNYITRTQQDKGFPLLEKMGMGWIREGAVQGNALPEIVATAEKNGINIMSYLQTVAEYDSQIDAAELERIEKTAAEYAAKYPYIAVWQFDNEWNTKRVNQGSFKGYVSLLKAFHTGVKKGNPKARVAGCVTTRADDGWIEGVLREGGGEFMDIVTIHPYQGNTTPEMANWVPYTMEIKNLLKRYGYEHLEVWVDEANTASNPEWNTEIQHGLNLVRHYALVEAYNPVDIFISYAFQSMDYDPSYGEHNYGAIRGWNVDNSYGAKPAFMAVCNYTAMTIGKTHSQVIHDEADDTYVHLYKGENGENVVMMYANCDVTHITLDLGAKSGTLYDMYGNEKKMYSETGIYSFGLNDMPYYFVGETTRLEKLENLIKFDKTIIEMPAGNKAKFVVSTNEDYEIKLVGRDSINAKAKKTAEGFEVEVNPTVFPEKVDFYGYKHYNGTAFNLDFIDVELYKNGKLCSNMVVAVDYIEKELDVELTFEPYNEKTDKHYVGKIEITNLSQKTVSGYVKMNEPDEIAKKLGKVRINGLKAGETKTIKFNIPSSFNKKAASYNGVFVKDGSGSEYEFHMGANARSTYYASPSAVNLTLVHKADKTPVIDGRILSDEWKEGFYSTFGAGDIAQGEEFVVDGVTHKTNAENGVTGVKADFGGSLYALWDDEYLYAAAVVNDSIHHNEEWNFAYYLSDSFSVRVAATNVQRSNTRIDYAMSTFNNNEPSAMINWSPVWDSKYCGNLRQGENGAEYAIIRDGITTTYEVKISWKNLINGGVKLNDNMMLMLTVRDYDVFQDKTVTLTDWACLVD